MATREAVSAESRFTGARMVAQLSAYARLANLKVYFQWIPALVAWSLAGRPFHLQAHQSIVLLLFAIGTIGVACSAGTLDDVQGAADGIDQRTYAGDDRLRGRAGKPIVQGEITERSARRFALVTGACGVAFGVTAVAIAAHRPWWLFPCWIVAAFAATQYSYGLKLSYRSLGELLLASEAVAVFAIPLVLLTGGVSRTGWFEAALLGTLFAQVTLFSSSQDAAIDRAAGRMTFAARLSARANRRLIAGVFLAGWSVTAVGFASGGLPPLLSLLLLPMWTIQLGQLVYGLGKRRWLVARCLGWRAFDVGVIALVLANLWT